MTILYFAGRAALAIGIVCLTITAAIVMAVARGCQVRA